MKIFRIQNKCSSLAVILGVLPLVMPSAWAQGAKDTPTPLLGYVVLGEKGHRLEGETQPLARIVLEVKDNGKDDLCKKLSMQGPENRKPVSELVKRVNQQPDKYPITLCETIIPFAKKFNPDGETWRLTLADQPNRSYVVQLPTVVRAPEHLFMLGDSGCRGDPAVQNCENAEWPLAASIPREIGQQIRASGTPAIIIHLGDYSYRRAPKDGEGASTPWAMWKKDFFDPMMGSQPQQNLFAMAPWVMTRGDHELCLFNAKPGSGPGWFYLLDPSSPLLGDTAALLSQHQCPTSDKTAAAATDVITTPYRLDFDNRFSLVVADSAAVDDTGINPEQVSRIKEMFTKLNTSWAQEGGKQRLAWFVTHKPLWVPAKDGNKMSNETEQQAIQELAGHRPPEPIKLVLGGDKHFYTSVDFRSSDNLPLGMVVGNSGVKINCGAFTGNSKKIDAAIHGMSAFGYVEAQLAGKEKSGRVTGWTLNSYGFDWDPMGKARELPELAETCNYPPPQGPGSACVMKAAKFFPAGGCRL